MPTQIDYSERGIWENIFDPGAWQNLLGGVDTVTSGVASVWERMEKQEGSQPLTPPPPPYQPYQPYQPTLTARDFAFTPNVTLLVIGGVILVLALALRGK